VRVQTVLLVLVLVVGALGPAWAAPSERMTLAVMYFTNRGAEGEWDWLRKGLADLLITDLASSDRLLLVERERMQAVLKELKVSESGAVDQAVALRAAQIARVDVALFGSYLVAGGEIEIEAHLIDLATGRLRRVEWVKGRAARVHELEKALAEKLIANLDVKLTAAERARLKKLQTDNLDAMAHFYRGLDRYDRGDYPHAFAGFRTAASRDRRYVHARLWVAKIYIAMDEVEHGLLAYRKALKDFPDDPLTPQLRFDYALALQHTVQDYEAAIRQYTRIIEAQPLSKRPHDEVLRERLDLLRAAQEKTIEWSDYRSFIARRAIESNMLRKALYGRGHCYHATGNLDRAVTDMYGVIARGPWAPNDRSGLAREAEKSLKVWYYDLAVSGAERSVLPSWTHRFETPDEAFVATSFDGPAFGDPLSCEIWGGRLLEAPAGSLFDTLSVRVELLPVERAGYAHFILRDWHGTEGAKSLYLIRNSDPKQLTYVWETDLAPDAKLLVLHRTRFGPRLKRIEIRPSFTKAPEPDSGRDATTFAEVRLFLRPEWAESWVNGSKTVRNYAKVPPGRATVTVAAPGYSTKEFGIDVPPEGIGLLVSLEDYWTPIVQIAHGLQRPSMVFDRRGLYRIVAEGQSEGVRHLYQLVSRDALHWGEAAKLNVNSGADDWAPHLIQAEDGTLVLAWQSTREGKDDTVVCVSTSKDGRTWTDPVLIRHRGEPEKRIIFGYSSLWQDADGVFWLQTTHGVYRSDDAHAWHLLPLKPDKMYHTSWRLPTIATHDGRLRLACSEYGTWLRGREALRALKMRPGETRSHNFASAQRQLVMLRDGSLFACGLIGAAGATPKNEGAGLAAFSADGKDWTTPYRHHGWGHASIVWDRGSRLVCVQETHPYGSLSGSSGSGLAVSFCDTAQLAGRPEQNPTELRILSPVEAASDSEMTLFFQRRRVNHLRVCDGRIFCILSRHPDGALGEIDPQTGEGRIHIESGIPIDFTTGPSWCDSDGECLWIATQKKGLLRFGLQGGEAKWYTTGEGLVSDNVRTVRCHKGKVYIGTLSGLNVLDPSTGQVQTITTQDGMPDNSVEAIAFQGQTMWLGAENNGAMKYDTRAKKWTHFAYDHEKIGKGGPDLLSTYVPAIFIEGDAVYFVGYGIAEYNTRTNEWRHYLRGAYSGTPVRDGNLLWYPSGTDGIFTLNLKTREVRKHFIRTPSFSSWQTNPNFPHRFDLLGEEVLITCHYPRVLCVSKQELLTNSFSYDAWLKANAPTGTGTSERPRQ